MNDNVDPHVVVYEDFREMLKHPGLKAILIATPTTEQCVQIVKQLDFLFVILSLVHASAVYSARQTISAINAGKHVLSNLLA